MKNAWFIIIPFAKGYMGKGKQGEVYGNTRMDVITLLLNLEYSNEKA